MAEILLYSIIIGAIGGGCLAAGAARMFHAPEVQAMGSFRTLGEMNACGGDPISHFSFGLGFLFSSAASAVAAGALTQDVFHRIVTNWAAGILMLRDKGSDAMQNPAKMMVAGAGVGAVVVAALNSVASIIPANLSAIASGVLVPATTWLINPVMPAIFWLAAIDGGKTTGLWSTILGGISALITGNALPGIVLGILVGKSAEENGYNSGVVKVLIAIIVVMFIAIAYFRGFFANFGL